MIVSGIEEMESLRRSLRGLEVEELALRLVPGETMVGTVAGSCLTWIELLEERDGMGDGY